MPAAPRERSRSRETAPVKRRAALTSLLSLPLIELASAAEPPAPGDAKSTRTKLLEAGAEMTQSEGPLRAIHAHVCGFHFYSGELGRQVVAHHYCAHRSEDFMQCVIYDSNDAKARLIGIEYIISAKLFATLPEEEKPLWHSHVYEVKSGQLIAPGIPEVAELELMKDLIGTYGKTIHTWQIDKHGDLPLGAPQLMMGFTGDGQGNEELIAKRDQVERVSTSEKRKKREPLAAPHVDQAANGWAHGKGVQLEFKPVK